MGNNRAKMMLQHRQALAPAPRPVIAIVIAWDRIAEILIDSGALAVLAEKADLHFIAGPDVTVELPDVHERLELPSLQGRLRWRLDHHMWNHALFRHFRHHRIDDRTSFKAAQLRPSVRHLHRWMAHPVFADAISALDARVFFRYDKQAVHYLKRLRPSLLIAPGSAIDSYSHMIMRSAQYLGIPTAMIVAHWDYFSKKGLLRVAPDRIYAWGNDMAKLAIEKNGLTPEVVRVVGAPQFEKYRHVPPGAQHDARAAIGLPVNGKLILFAGTSLPFDELSVLQELNAIMARSAFTDCRIVYRPHPRAWKRRSVTTVNPAQLSNVILDLPTAEQATSDAHYLRLMHAVDGVVSPMSTMVLEGALVGKPALCFAFSDGINDWNFAEASNADHIHALTGRSWLSICRARHQVERQFGDYLALLYRHEIARQIRQEADLTVYSDDRCYAQRLAQQIEGDFSLGLFAKTDLSVDDSSSRTLG